MTKPARTAVYLRVSTDGQTVENQRLALQEVAARRGWTITQEYVDAGISGAKGRDKRPAFDQMLKDAARRRFDMVAVWAIDRLGRSTATVATTLTELEHLGVNFFADKEGVDSSTPHGRAMLQMASVFAELERGMIRERVNAGLKRARAQGKTLGRPRTSKKTEEAVRGRLEGGSGILKVAKELGVGVSVVQRVKASMLAASAAPLSGP